MAEQPQPMDEQQLVGLVNAEFEQAMGGPGGDIGLERAKAWNYYLSKKLGNEQEGQSQVVTSDVADVVDGMMPSLLEIFTTADNLVSFDAVGPEDKQAAEQESDYVNYVFFKQNPAFLILFFWFFDALVQKNGYVKAWWDESEVVTRESYRGLSDLEAAELLMDDELEPIEWDERQDLTVVDVAEPAPDGGVAVGQTIGVGLVHDITFRRVSKRGRVCVENVPPEEFRISSDSKTLDPAAARFSGHERETTRSELRAMGIDKKLVDELEMAGSPGAEAANRRDKSDETKANAGTSAPGGTRDRSQDKILVREGYIKVDFDGDGFAELRKVLVAGDKMLVNEEIDRSTFHVLSPKPLPHKHHGQALAEKVMDVQDVTTTVTRQTLDNLYHTNNPSHGVWENAIGENTLDDLLTTRAGSIKRFARPPAEAYQPITVPFTAAASFPMLQHFDKVKRDRTGISSDSEGLSPDALKNIQISVLAETQDLSRKKISAIARIFAETGIKSLFLHIHELCLKHQQKAKMVELRNTWVKVDPRSWRTRMDMTVQIGLGIGTRRENLLHLNAIWEKQKEIVAAQGGFGGLVTPMNAYNTAAEVVKNANLKNPEMFFTPTDEIPSQGGGGDELAQVQAQLAARQQELDAARTDLQRTKVLLEERREGERIALERDKEENRLFVEMEKMKNTLTEFELKYGANVPGSRV